MTTSAMPYLLKYGLYQITSVVKQLILNDCVIEYIPLDIVVVEL